MSRFYGSHKSAKSFLSQVLYRLITVQTFGGRKALGIWQIERDYNFLPKVEVFGV